MKQHLGALALLVADYDEAIALPTEKAARLALRTQQVLAFETDVATVAMAPVHDDSLVLVAAARSIPLGLVRRVLQQCGRRADGWLGTTS